MKALKITLIVLGLIIPWPMFLPAAIGLWVFDIGYESAGWLIRHNLVGKTATDI